MRKLSVLGVFVVVGIFTFLPLSSVSSLAVTQIALGDVQVLPQLPLDLQQLQRELARERLIRIVEPVVYPLQRMGFAGYNYNWVELFNSCGLLGHANALQTEMGQAWTRCEGDTPFDVAIEGPNRPEGIYGNRTVRVEVQGFNTHENLCWLNEDKAGISDTRRFCDEKKNGRVKAVIIARFIFTTKVLWYTKKEVDEIIRRRKEQEDRDRKEGIVTEIIGSIFRLPAEGDVKSQKLTFSPVVYEFLDEKK